MSLTLRECVIQRVDWIKGIVFGEVCREDALRVFLKGVRDFHCWSVSLCSHSVDDFQRVTSTYVVVGSTLSISQSLGIADSSPFSS